MLRNPLCFTVQVLVGILQTAQDASTVAALTDYVPGLDAATSVLTANCAGHDESCIMMSFLIPSTITSCHVAHSLAIGSPSSQLFSSGLGDSTGDNKCLEIRFASLSRCIYEALLYLHAARIAMGLLLTFASLLHH
ncbi:hypothetical protein MRX96_028036 [Rhipicephalus microplus]